MNLDEVGVTMSKPDQEKRVGNRIPKYLSCEEKKRIVAAKSIFAFIAFNNTLDKIFIIFCKGLRSLF